MKRMIILFLIILCLPVVGASLINESTHYLVVQYTVGSATYNTTTSLLRLTIDSPSNDSIWSNNLTIDLNFTTQNQDQCWYNTNQGSDTPLSSCANTTFLAVQEENNITVYVNDSYSNTISNTRTFWSYNESPEIDTLNWSVTAESITITFNSSQLSNLTMNYNLTEELGIEYVNDTFQYDYNFTISVESGQNYSFNLTPCNKAGYCTTNGTYTFSTPSTTTETITEETSYQGGTNIHVLALCYEGQTVIVNGTNLCQYCSGVIILDASGQYKCADCPPEYYFNPNKGGCVLKEEITYTPPITTQWLNNIITKLSPNNPSLGIIILLLLLGIIALIITSYVTQSLSKKKPPKE